jgi:multidrug resistance efflux pump
MKRFNLLYLAIIPLSYVLFQMNAKLGKTSVLFYGFAENKETELSEDQPVLIHKIFVTPGQEVAKGQLLMEVKQTDIDFKLLSLSHDLERLEIMKQQQKQSLQNRINQLNAKKISKVAEIEAEIKNLEATIRYNQSLLEDLKSFDNQKVNPENSPNAIKLAALKENIQLEIEPINIEIKQLEYELAAIKTPSEVQQQKLKNDIDYYKNEQQKLVILAPSDGLVGNILCKKGENIPAFSTLINFYERNPTIVKGFVHESLILQVKVGDSLSIASSLHPAHQVRGKVIGLGSRIVEIPERLRKDPVIKTYGREVLIRIPSDNLFLQKEKVILNSLTEEAPGSVAFFLSIFNLNDKTQNSQNTSAKTAKY